MKIVSIDIFAIDAASKRRRPIVCRINTDEGIYGYGEASVSNGLSASAVFNMIGELFELIRSMDPTDNEVIWHKMFWNGYWGQAGGVAYYAAMSAIDMALMDIKGKLFDVPVYKLLGGKFRDQLRCYASQIQSGWGDQLVNCGAVDDYVKASLSAVQQGYDALKIDFLRFDKEGKPLDPDKKRGILKRDVLSMVEERISAVREAVGPNVDIMIEGHGDSDAVSAEQIARMAEKYQIAFYEEATSPMNPDMTRAIRDRINMPIAGGERIFTRWGFYNFFKGDMIQVAQPDIGNCGGITEAKKICDMAQVFDVRIQTHVSGTPIIRAASLQFEAAIPNFYIHEDHREGQTQSIIELGIYNYQPVNGYFHVPDLPGIGQELSEQAIKRSVIKTVK